MSRTRGFYLVALFAVMLISAIWVFVIKREHSLPVETAEIVTCDSCTARHGNLTRLRDARSLTAITDE